MTHADGTRFDATSFAPIAAATRSHLDESLHHGAAVVVDASGAVTAAIGDAELLIHPRSALKPFQADAMTKLGLELPHRLLAVAAASHSGEPHHLEAVEEILRRHDLEVSDLANTPTLPHGKDARETARRHGRSPSSLQQNCSGKHAAMLATCRVNGWAIDSYLDPEHPLQEAIIEHIDALAARDGGSVADVGVDGCGAPTHVMPLVDVARALGALLKDGSVVAVAMSSEPAMVGGTDRDVTIWMNSIPGLVAKEGAAGVMLLGLPDGRAAALKIADGSDAARQAATPELLRRLGVDVDAEHHDALERVGVPVLGHGQIVGAIRSLPWI